ncbi:hypothetical protein [Rhizobium hainanense]|uniref:hypothetical protein n=1 Tax=Rhizobium hainanense TaxID=52131 RepID=UPI00096A3E6B|nr:hypothetical protein [Rhizobium hainanense]
MLWLQLNSIVRCGEIAAKKEVGFSRNGREMMQRLYFFANAKGFRRAINAYSILFLEAHCGFA